jgi:hypothetical protein
MLFDDAQDIARHGFTWADTPTLMEEIGDHGWHITIRRAPHRGDYRYQVTVSAIRIADQNVRTQSAPTLHEAMIRAFAVFLRWWDDRPQE